MLSRFDLVMFAMLFASSSLFAMLFPCSLDSAPTTGLRTPCKKSELVGHQLFLFDNADGCSVAKYLSKGDDCELMGGEGLWCVTVCAREQMQMSRSRASFH